MVDVTAPVTIAEHVLPSRSRRAGLAAFAAVSATASSLAAYLLISWVFGSWEAGIRYINGERLMVLRSTADLGRIRKGDSRSVTFKITNHSDVAVRVLGSSSECPCTTAVGLPLTIDSGKTSSVAIRFEAEGQSRAFKQAVTLFTDFPKRKALQLIVRGQVEDQ